MLRDWLQGVRKYLVGTCATLAFTAGTTYAADNDELLQRLDQQSREIQELKARLDAQPATPLADKATDGAAIDAKAVQNIVADYLKDHPGAGMPSGVQTGWSPSKGFYVDSPPNPTYTNWQDESKIPFELRIRGRIQIDEHFYKVTDDFNHLAQRLTYPTTTGNTVNGNGNPLSKVGANSTPDFNQLELKRVRLIFEGTAFDPNLRYNVQLDGNTRGITGVGPQAFVGTAAGSGGGVATVDHAVRLFGAFIAYDWHPCCGDKGCGTDCCDGSYKYAPTVTFIAGKIKPFFSFEEVLGSANEQFVEYAMSEWFFDADDDNLQTQAGIEAKFLEDRAFLHATINNSNESQTANLNNQRIPAINIGGWYDFGGSWNDARKRWDLYGDSAADVDYSCKPVVRVGAASYISLMDRRSEYGNAVLGRIRAVESVPGGGNSLDAVLTNLDKFDEYSFEAFWAGKYRGFSILNDWWVRDINNLQGTRNAFGQNNAVLFNTWDGVAGNALAGVPALFPRNKSLTDYGMNLQGGYFIVPKKMEIVARWSFIKGVSGDINGNGTFTNVNAAQSRLLGVPVGTRIVNGAFTHEHESDEYAIGFNYYWKRQLLKWQTDLSYYTGGNPAAGGQSPAGFIPGVNGYGIRTMIQLMF